MTTKVLTDSIDDMRPEAVSRNGISVTTDVGKILEVSGGSHASCVVNDGGRIAEQLAALITCNPFPLSGRGASSRVERDLSEMIVTYTGEERSRVYFTSGGTESIETSARLAYHTQQIRGEYKRTIIIGRRVSYHGMSILARNIGDHPVHSNLPEDLDFNWPKLVEPRCSDCPFGLSRPSCHMECAEQLEEIILRCGEDKVAAVILEPVSGTTGGALSSPEGYISRISEICGKYGVLLIADEVVTAFGRTGKYFVSEIGEVDFIAGGKCLAGGWAPLGCVIVSGEICQELRHSRKSVPLRLTFSGNPTACAAGLCVQRYIQEEGLLSAVARNTRYIGGILAQEFVNADSECSVEGSGNLWAVSRKLRDISPEAAATAVVNEARRIGVEALIAARQGVKDNWLHIVFSPAFDCTDAQLHEAVEKISDLVGLLRSGDIVSNKRT